MFGVEKKDIVNLVFYQSSQPAFDNTNFDLPNLDRATNWGVGTFTYAMTGAETLALGAAATMAAMAAFF